MISEAIEVREEQAPIVREPGSVLEGLEPEQVTARAIAIAKNLADVLEKCKLYSLIQGRKYVRVEGWETLGAMLGEAAKERTVERCEDGSYCATVDIVRNRDLGVVGGASAIVGMDEEIWAQRKEYARRSMAITRATGKAFRIRHAWIMSLAGYETTPAEEMPAEEMDGGALRNKRTGTAPPTPTPTSEKPGKHSAQVILDSASVGKSKAGSEVMRVTIKGGGEFALWDKGSFERMSQLTMRHAEVGVDYTEKTKGGRVYRDIEDFWEIKHPTTPPVDAIANHEEAQDHGEPPF